MSFGWEFPPGVSGLEPQITGEWPIDPQAPWMAVDGWGVEYPAFAVIKGDPDAPLEELPMATMAEAEAFERLLNGIASMGEAAP